MKKKLLCALLAAAMIVSLAACGGTPAASSSAASAAASSNASGDTITVTDHNGNVVTLPKNVQRIVVCDIFPLPSVLSVFFDSAKKLVGIAPASMTAAKNSLLSELYPEILKADTGFINGSEVNIEELAKLKPDVVFYSASSKELGDTLTRAGFNAVAISVNKWGYNAIETLNNWISLLSQIFPDNNRAQTVQDYSNEIYTMVQKRIAGISDAERERVFFLFQYNDSTIMTSGQQFFGQWWASAVGAVNVAEELTKDNSVAVNLEQIYTWNPEMIFITNFTTAQPQDLYNNTIGSYDWSGVKAVQDKAVYKMPLGMYRSYTPGVDTPITLLWLAKTVYPDLFSDIDVTAKAVDYYKTVFGVTLTTKQAESIFAPTSAAGNVNF
jgi:iron complex transport system substrate-binding protein